MATILVINGPNINLLGTREPHIYGEKTMDEINFGLEEVARSRGVQIEFFQSNHEGHLVDCIQAARDRIDCIVINAGALTHYSIALHDALRAAELPVIEVHISNPYAREEFRHRSYISPIAVGGIFGFGPLSYRLAVEMAIQLVKS
ncbi:MAG: type II 3-dehydroquinate dehydratase [Syntrophomonadaceae bacterium]|nr:type II 3-dehydroquinate dehydratase [Syntrophomonadaceae bacterium]